MEIRDFVPHWMRRGYRRAVPPVESSTKVTLNERRLPKDQGRKKSHEEGKGGTVDFFA